MKNQHKGRINKKTRNPEPEKSGPCPGTGNCGFTLLEIIAVLVIAAIAAAVIINSVSRSKADLTGRSEALRAHIRYAQSMAMSTDDQNWGIRFDAEDDWYCLFRCDSGEDCEWGEADRISIPGTDSDQNRVLLGEEGIDITETTKTILVFDNFGAPSSRDEDELLKNKLTNDPFTIDLSQAGDSETITVTPTTGFVQ